jgi:hypothetical protein
MRVIYNILDIYIYIWVDFLIILFSDYGSISFYLLPSRSISLGLNEMLMVRVGKIYDVTPFFEKS